MEPSEDKGELQTTLSVIASLVWCGAGRLTHLPGPDSSVDTTITDASRETTRPRQEITQRDRRLAGKGEGGNCANACRGIDTG